MNAAAKGQFAHVATRAYRAVRQLWRLARDPAYRHVLRLNSRPPPLAFQPFNDTKADRYPRFFRFVQESLGGDEILRILSFGCSTGEEVFTLHRYFPRASIKGIDINPGNIAVCRKRLARADADGLTFEVAGATRAEPALAYDAIFCMAVLRHGQLSEPGVTRCDHLIRFADFAMMIADFKRCLKPGGLLVVRHSNFRISDTPVAADFEMILSVPYPDATKVPIFGPDNRLLPGVRDPDVVFRKRC